jgi:hypothetical protein
VWAAKMRHGGDVLRQRPLILLRFSATFGAFPRTCTRISGAVPARCGFGPLKAFGSTTSYFPAGPGCDSTVPEIL